MKTYKDLLEGSAIFSEYTRNDIIDSKNPEKELLKAIEYYSKHPYERLTTFFTNMRAKPASSSGYKILKQFTISDRNFNEIKITFLKKSSTDFMLMVVGGRVSRQLAFSIAKKDIK
jgi:hypothetical protein